jgi:hypothetical protein
MPAPSAVTHLLHSLMPDVGHAILGAAGGTSTVWDTTSTVSKLR